MKDFAKYKNRLPFGHTDQQTRYFEINEELIKKAPLSLPEREKQLNKLMEEERKSLLMAFDKYRKELTRLRKLFEHDCEVEFDFTDMNTEIKNKIHEIAWLWKDSSYESAYTKYQDLIELVKIAQKGEN